MILETYIYREVREKLLWLVGLLVMILTSHRFVDYLADAASGKIPSDLIFSMLAMKILAIIPRILPVAIFLSVILALTRLASDRELTIMTGSGLSTNFQMGTVFKFSLIYASFVTITSFFISPWAETEVSRLKEQAKMESDITGITAGRFKEFSKGDRIVYVKDLSNDRQSMEEVFLQIRENDRLSLLASDRARFIYDDLSGSRYILFENGHRYVGQPGELNYQITKYQGYAVLLEQGTPGGPAGKLETLSSSDLLGSDLPAYKAEFQWRLGYVIAGLLLPLLAVSLNRFSFGNSRYVSIITGLLIYLIYSNLLSISKTLIKREDIPAFIGMWWVHGLLLLMIIGLFKIQTMVFKLRKKDTQTVSTVS